MFGSDHQISTSAFLLLTKADFKEISISYLNFVNWNLVNYGAIYLVMHVYTNKQMRVRVFSSLIKQFDLGGV